MSDRTAAIEAVQARLEAERAWVVELTQRMVRVPTVNPKFQPDPAINREAELQALLEPVLQEEGFATEQLDALPGRPNLVGERPGSEERSLILCGHIDTVPVGAASDWTVDPFGGEVKDGRLYGRGAIDMKSGVAACIAAARAIRQEGLELEGRLALHAVVDE